MSEYKIGCKIYLFLFLSITFIISGCQHAGTQTSHTQQFNSTADRAGFNSGSRSSHSSADGLSLDQRQDAQTGKINPFIQSSEKEEEYDATEIESAAADDNEKSFGQAGSQEKNDDKLLSAETQDKIDQALELCSQAQQMWEKGKIEEALASLDSAYFSILEIDTQVSPEQNQQKEDIRYLISKRILEIYASRQIVVNGQHNEIPITLNTYVKAEITNLTGPERSFFIQSFERSYRYRPYILEELRKAGLPEDISWLPLIESGFKIRALSKARALGLWQFIPSTGYKFGLSRNYYIDERLDPEKSTKAAIAYLKELHNLFGDWTTALAAYNCGEARVLGIIRRQKINYLDNFWDLFQNLPRETSRYVPRFLATLHIINNLDQYGIEVNSPVEPIPYKTCEIKKQVLLKDIAKEIQVDTKILKELNPELRYALLPMETYQLRIPEEKEALFISKIDTIKTTYSPPPMFVYHRVRRGETISGIAKKYRTSVRAIASVNRLNRRYTIIAGKVLKIPSQGNYASQGIAAQDQVKPGQTLTYRVRSGDNLWKIARNFGTTTKTLMLVNKLPDTRLNVGQTLYITAKGQPAANIADESSKGLSKYLVQSGDSPFLIAKKHHMDLNRFLVLNRLDKRSTIFPGQELLVE